jgi:hypothetical protein
VVLAVAAIRVANSVQRMPILSIGHPIADQRAQGIAANVHNEHVHQGPLCATTGPRNEAVSRGLNTNPNQPWPQKGCNFVQHAALNRQACVPPISWVVDLPRLKPRPAPRVR